MRFALRLETQRHAANRARILRHVFTDASVAARHAAHQQTIFVLQRQRQTIDLELGDVFELPPFSQPLATLVERAQLVDVVAVVERQHLAACEQLREILPRAGRQLAVSDCQA